MENILFENHYITLDGYVYENLTNKLIEGIPSKSSTLVYSITGHSESLDRTICQHIFKLNVHTLSVIEIGHINRSWIYNSFNNLKIYSKKDKNNKSGYYIALFNHVPFLYSNGKPLHESLDYRQDLNLF